MPSKENLLSSLLETARDPSTTNRSRQLSGNADHELLNPEGPKDDSDSSLPQRAVSTRRKRPSFVDCYREDNLQLGAKDLQ